MSKPSKKQDPLEQMIASLPDNKSRKETWTLQEDAMLLKYGDSKGIANVAAAMGKSRNAAYSRVKYLKANLK